ncbi:MAG TPA: OstA-like protein [Candidatus Kapabacteria bacterium]|nr:OstA-like protein [Candidatus Kapabacteria bacterium]
MYKYIPFIALISYILLFAETSQNINNDIILENADSLVGSTFNEQSYREFYGNVVLKHRDVIVKSKYAKQYIEQNKADLLGNVKIEQNTMLLLSPKIHYDGNAAFAYAYDSVKIIDKKTVLKATEGSYDIKNYIADFIINVNIEDDSINIFANRIVYNRATRVSKAFGDVFIKGKFTDVLITADTIYSFPNDNYYAAFGKPVLYKIDTTYITDSLDSYNTMAKYDTLTISADTMEAFRNTSNEYYKFSGNVELVKGDIMTKSNEAIYSKDSIILNHKPIVWYKQSQLYADSIIIKLKDNKVKNLYAFNNSIMVMVHDSIEKNRFNQIVGKDIIIDIDSATVQSVYSNGDAKSLYFFADDKGENGVDRKSTDSIRIKFDNGEVDKIYWIGTTIAEFIPENLIFDDPMKFNLPLFQWNEDKPKQKQLILRANMKK